MGVYLPKLTTKRNNLFNSLKQNDKNISADLFLLKMEYNREITGKYKNVIRYSEIKAALKENVKHDPERGPILYRESFNRVIVTVFKFDIPILCQTFLCERLYQLILESSGMHNEEFITAPDLINGIKYILLSDEAKFRVSFEAMRTGVRDRNEVRPYLNVEDIVDYCSKSCLYAFHLLYILISQQWRDEFDTRGLYIPHFEEFDYAIKKNQMNLKDYVANSLSNKVQISYEDFKKWISTDIDLEISYYNKRVKVALTLLCLKDIGLLID